MLFGRSLFFFQKKRVPNLPQMARGSKRFQAVQVEKVEVLFPSLFLQNSLKAVSLGVR